jgi:hemin uptake protein HemP
MDQEADRRKPEDKPVVVNSATLFQGQREIVIQHEGVCYRLRITRKGKLILQK